MIEFTDKELNLIYEQIDDIDFSCSDLDKLAMAIKRKIEQHFGWDWNG